MKCEYSREVPSHAVATVDMWVRRWSHCDNPAHDKTDYQPRTAHRWIEDGRQKGLWHWGDCTQPLTQSSIDVTYPLERKGTTYNE